MLGFDKVWRADKHGYTNHLPGSNFAIRKSVFNSIGGFKKYKIVGGEDTDFEIKIAKKGFKIKYNPLQIVYHAERDNLRDFINWKLRAGRGIYHFQQHNGKIQKYIRLRVWSFMNTIIKSGPLFWPPVIFLYILSLICLKIGHTQEKKKYNK